MIISFADGGTEDIFHGINSKKASAKLHRSLWEKATSKLDILNRAYRLEDLRTPPNNKLEKLVGDLEGQYSIRINNQYRIIFYWSSSKNEASEVKIVDHH